MKSSLYISAICLGGLLAVQTSVSALPYDPYPWCAQYADDGGGDTNCGLRTFEQCRATVSGLGGGTNCGFLTLEQCRATVSGIGGYCVPNQFYNPRGGRSPRSRHL
jgi:hypothetical protein